MSIGSHIVAGLLIGKLTGDYTTSIIASLIIDIDHFIPFIKHKVILSPRKLWEIVTNKDDPFGNQRNYLHSIFAWVPISIIAILINFNVGIVISIAYLVHLLLDALDSSDFYPFYPMKWNLKGPVEYLSGGEFVFTLIMLLIYLI